MPRIGNPRAAYSYREDIDEERDDADVVVQLDDYRPDALPDTFDEDGDPVKPASRRDPGAEDDFARNLAEDYEEEFLDALGEDLIEQVEQAIEERQPWRDRFERGLEQMGLIESDIDDGPFPGASNAVHPLLIEARTQFWARAMAELWPPDGPCKEKVQGAQTEAMLERAERVKEYSNWQMTVEDEAATEEFSSLLWDTPFYGSTFWKTFRDPILDHNSGVYVPAEDLIVPAEAKSLRTAPFFAHRMRKWPNEVKALQLVGFYRECQIELPSTEETNEVEEIKNETQDVEPDGDEHGIRHELFEVCIDRELPGDEHLDADGEPTGLKRTYYITVDRHSRKVLAIYRGWREEDPKCNRDLFIEHFRFCPPGAGGFYGSGLFHLIGGLQTAATGALRVLLDSAASASLSGGFISRHANMKGKRLVFTPGVWEPVDASAEDLNKAFVSPPVKEPSPALFNLLGFLTERGEKYTATTELQTGDADPKGAPVGTTNMMLEQGGKVMSTIHRMLHNSLGRVLRTRHRLNRIFAPAEGYPYDVEDQQRTVYADDFAPGVSIVPVSDPNIYSSTQRISIYQTVLQTVLQTGQGNLKKVVRRFFGALRVPDLDDILPDDAEAQAYDAVGEIQAMLMGKPVKVLPEQMHVQHIQVLAAFMQNPQYGGNKLIQQQVGPAMLQVMGQHLAYAWTTHARGLGVPVGYMDPESGQVQSQGTPEQIAAMLAQIAPHIATAPGMPAIDAEGEGGDKEKLQIEMAKLDLKREEHQQEMAQDREKHAFELEKERSKLEAQKQLNEQKVQVAAQKAQSDLQIAQQKAQVAMQQQQMDAHVKQQQAATDAVMQQEQSQRDAQMAQQEMDNKTQLGQQKMAQDQAMGNQKMQQADQAHQQKMAQGQAASQQQADPLAHLRDGDGAALE